MIDFAQARRTMVDGQVRVNDVTDAALIAAMLEVPREKFVPEARAQLAYIDDDLCVQEAAAGRPARYLMEPMVLAKMIQGLELTPESKVLDVGCATGYSSMVLSRVAGRVVALEADATLAAFCEEGDFRPERGGRFRSGGCGMGFGAAVRRYPGRRRGRGDSGGACGAASGRGPAGCGDSEGSRSRKPRFSPAQAST
jgi:hypothetical protein